MLSVLFMLFYLFIKFLCFTSQRSHLLVILLSLGFIVLSLYLYMTYCFISDQEESYFCLLFLSFGVCQGALGLSIMVSVTRTHGNDYFNYFFIIEVLKYIFLFYIFDPFKI